MASAKNSVSWQDMRRILASKSKNEILNLIRDLYAQNPENKNFIHAQVLAPQPTQRRKASTKAIQQSSASQIAPKIRRLVNVATQLQQGNAFNVTRLTTLKSLCEDPKGAAKFAVHIAKLTYPQRSVKRTHLCSEKGTHQVHGRF